MKDRGIGKEGCASPQQLDGISNIRSWNVRNAGQSDLTEKEGGEDRRVRKDQKTKQNKTKRRGRDRGKSGTVKESTLAIIVNIKSPCLWTDWHAMEQISNSVSVGGCGSHSQPLRLSVALCVAQGLVPYVLPDFIQTNTGQACGGGGWWFTS